MKKPIHVGAYIQESAFPTLALLLAIIGAIGTAAWVGAQGLLLLAPFILVLLGGMVVIDRIKKRLSHRGVSLSDAGISATVDGVATWTLPWSQYGGYRQIEASHKMRVFHPEQCGTEILNREGVVVGMLNVEPSRHQSTSLHPGRFRGLFWRILDKRSTLPGEGLEPRPNTTTSDKVAMQALVGIAFGAVSSSLFSSHFYLQRAVENDSTIYMNPLYGLGGFIFMMVALTLFGVAAKGLTLLRFPKLYKRLTSSTRESIPQSASPADGPRYEDFLIENGGDPDPIELEDGVRYVQVDPEQRLANDQSLWPVIAFLSIYPVVCVIFFFADLCQRPILAALGAATAALVLLVSDTIIPMEGGLTVIHQDGRHLSFSPRASRKLRTAMNAPKYLKLEVWKEGKKRYILDRTHLIKASVQLDHEELKELEQELQI